MRTFFSTCVDWPKSDVNATGGLCDMIDSGRDITRRTFLRNVDKQSFREVERGLGYPMGRLTMAADYAVSYERGKLHGKTVYWFNWSSIEHVFTHNAP